MNNNSTTAECCPVCGNLELLTSPAILMPFVADRLFGWKPVTVDETWGLHSIHAGTAYSICNSAGCAECDFIFMDIRPKKNDMQRLYRNYRDDVYTELRESYEPGYAERNESLLDGYEYIAKIEDYIVSQSGKPNSILDWGGDTGKNTPFKDSKIPIYLYDISGKASYESASSISEASDNFELLVCSQVLEHVSDPVEELRSMANMVPSGGHLYFDVPFEKLMQSESSVLDRIKLKRHWHEHINFFSQNSFARLAEVAGFKIVHQQILDNSSTKIGGKILQLICQKK